ncbi:MAG: hypothetical protein CMP58_04720 [Flavobacteriales bacterium]|nr:hypothetical protein [Flavobacteriales bacterium]|tara:strand:- start:94 stop:462 length:369 start_codon:yes stop_codon:yes gene_type:complete
MRKVLLTLTAAIMMVGLSAQSIGWAKLASVDANGVNWSNPSVGVNVGGDFDLVLSYSDEFDFAVRKAMSFGFVEVGGFGDGDDMTIAFGRQFSALMDGMMFEPTLTWADDEMSMSMGVTVAF